MFKDKMEMLVKALPNYKKGKKQLKIKRFTEEDEFCCLGVACDLYMKETGIGEWNQGGFSIADSEGYQEDFESLVLPEKVQEWLGAKSKHGNILSYLRYGGRSLVNINDSSDDWGPVIQALERHWEEI